MTYGVTRDKVTLIAEYKETGTIDCKFNKSFVEVEKVDPESGEIVTVTENRIVEWEGNFIYYNNAILADIYGKKDYSTGKDTEKGRKVAVIEDIATCINELLNFDRYLICHLH